MRIQKGDAGYIRAKKKRAIVKTILEFGIVAALLILGIVETGDRMNWLTIVAILGCLPASKALVEYIMILPHKSIALEKAEEIATKTSHLTTGYDFVFTSEKIIMPVESVAISDNTIVGYTEKAKLDTNVVSKHIKQYLNANQYTKVSVKIFDNYTAFVARAEEMNRLASTESNDTKKKEEAIRRVLSNISL